jgi:hypothetical protein
MRTLLSERPDRLQKIALAVSKQFRTEVIDNFRSFALKNLGRSSHALYAKRS